MIVTRWSYGELFYRISRLAVMRVRLYNPSWSRVVEEPGSVLSKSLQSRRVMCVWWRGESVWAFSCSQFSTTCFCGINTGACAHGVREWAKGHMMRKNREQMSKGLINFLLCRVVLRRFFMFRTSCLVVAYAFVQWSHNGDQQVIHLFKQFPAKGCNGIVFTVCPLLWRREMTL